MPPALLEMTHPGAGGALEETKVFEDRGTEMGAKLNSLGLHEITTSAGVSALVYVPEAATKDEYAPLVVMLHGAGGTGRHCVDLIRPFADRLGFIVLAPSSQAATWDIIAQRRFGSDARSLDLLLRQLSGEYSVDSSRIAIGGFSDGASYALSLGLMKGEQFSDIIAFSPGFAAPANPSGNPRIFISHGVTDQVLPVEQCSRRIVPQLRSARYNVGYVEFPGGHLVPEHVAAAAFEKFLGPREE